MIKCKGNIVQAAKKSLEDYDLRAHDWYSFCLNECGVYHIWARNIDRKSGFIYQQQMFDYEQNNKLNEDLFKSAVLILQTQQ